MSNWLGGAAQEGVDRQPLGRLDVAAVPEHQPRDMDRSASDAHQSLWQRACRRVPEVLVDVDERQPVDVGLAVEAVVVGRHLRRPPLATGSRLSATSGICARQSSVEPLS
jgi:hypothetical protein